MCQIVSKVSLPSTPLTGLLTVLGLGGHVEHAARTPAKMLDEVLNRKGDGSVVLGVRCCGNLVATCPTL